MPKVQLFQNHVHPSDNNQARNPDGITYIHILHTEQVTSVVKYATCVLQVPGSNVHRMKTYTDSSYIAKCYRENGHSCFSLFARKGKVLPV
jgi:hypothetical protein